MYISMKNAVNLLEKSIKISQFHLLEIGSLWISIKYGGLDLGSEWIPCLLRRRIYAPSGSVGKL